MAFVKKAKAPEGPQPDNNALRVAESRRAHQVKILTARLLVARDTFTGNFDPGMRQEFERNLLAQEAELVRISELEGVELVKAYAPDTWPPAPPAQPFSELVNRGAPAFNAMLPPGWQG